jgi:LPXTG-site transpeptidase (sortase) family protein
MTVRNRSDGASQSVVVGLPPHWIDRFEIIGAIPPVLDDRAEDDGYRSLDFPGPAPREDATLELQLVASGEEVGAPAVRLALRDGQSLGELEPRIVGAPPRPGPVRALSIPRLGIRTGVVDTGWEPPPFVAGQIETTAALGEGNSVLVGHRGGRAGDAFAHLVGARLGDDVVAVSRGTEYRYVISAIRILPGSDSTPIEPTETPRLTLMTCSGIWNPLTSDYSHRLWVIAEPPDLARATLAATVARASQTAATSASPSEAAQARAEAAFARAALALLRADRRNRP